MRCARPSLQQRRPSCGWGEESRPCILADGELSLLRSGWMSGELAFEKHPSSLKGVWGRYAESRSTRFYWAISHAPGGFTVVLGCMNISAELPLLQRDVTASALFSDFTLAVISWV
jgi:hypothetical protein